MLCPVLAPAPLRANRGLPAKLSVLEVERSDAAPDAAHKGV